MGSLPATGLSGPPKRLLRWGNDGLAIATTNSQIMIFRGLLVPTNPPVDLVLRQSVSTLTARAVVSSVTPRSKMRSAKKPNEV